MLVFSSQNLIVRSSNKMLSEKYIGKDAILKERMSSFFKLHPSFLAKASDKVLKNNYFKTFDVNAEIWFSTLERK